MSSKTNDPPSSEPTWLRRMNECKVKHRPSLKNWSNDGFGIEGRRAEALRQLTDVRALEYTKGIDRVPASQLSVNDFIKRYEKPAIPVVIANIPQNEGWSSMNGEWTDMEWLRTRFGDRLFKVGEDDDGYKVKVKLKYFLSYLRVNTDDSPLYVFDSTFDDDSVSKSLLDGYSVPSYFRDDLFSLVGEQRRPPYRWWLCGPARSGTCVHIDPLGTSAWNTLLLGRKRWVIFPPSTHKKIAKALCVIKKGEDDEAINYFVDHLPRLMRQIKRDEWAWKEARRRPDGDSVCADCHSNNSTSMSISSGRTTRDSLGSSSSSSSCCSSSSSSGNDEAGSCSSCGKALPENPHSKYGCSSDEIIEFTQYPGETIFVPGSWWHAVINMDDTVAITQNFCSKTNFAKVWREARAGRKKMSCKWLKRLRESHPDLADQAEQINKDDDFIMYYERRKLKEEARAAKRALKAQERAHREARKLGVATEEAHINFKAVPPPPPTIDTATPALSTQATAGSGGRYGTVSVSSEESSDEVTKKSMKRDGKKDKKNYKHESKHSAERREAKRKLKTAGTVTDSSDESTMASHESSESDSKRRKKVSSK
jgi:hypothetical protein